MYSEALFAVTGRSLRVRSSAALGVKVVLVRRWEVASVLLSMTMLEGDESGEIGCPPCGIADPPG